MNKYLIAAIVVIILILVFTYRCSCGCKLAVCIINGKHGCCNEKFGTTNFVNKTRTVTLHYANWCNACKLMKPIWNQVKVATQGSGIIFVEVDEELAKTGDVSLLPTIRLRDEFGKLHEYHGPKEFENLRNWVVSPIPVDY